MHENGENATNLTGGWSRWPKAIGKVPHIRRTGMPRKWNMKKTSALGRND
jgi:hypothetical protein